MYNSESSTESVFGLTVLVNSVLLILKKEREKWVLIPYMFSLVMKAILFVFKTNLYHSVEEGDQGNIIT